MKKTWFLTRQKIKFIRSVRFIQSLWRRRNDRKHAVVDAFDMNNGSYEFLVTEDGLKILHKYIDEQGFAVPARIETSKILDNDKHNEKVFLDIIKNTQNTPVNKNYKKIVDEISLKNF